MGLIEPKAAITGVRGPLGRLPDMWSWEIGNGGECAPLDLAMTPTGRVESVQVEGEFGKGGSVRLMGTNDGENWQPLRDRIGMEIMLLAPGLVSIMEQVRMIRPECSGVDRIVVTTYAKGVG